MKPAIRFGTGAAVAVCLLLAAALPAARGDDPPAGIHPDLAAALAQANAAGKLLLVDFSGAWCPWCVKMDKTFADPAVAALLEKNFLYLKLDVGQFTLHTDCLKRYDIKGIPHLMVFSADGSVRKVQGGYSDPEPFAKFLRQAHGDEAEAAAAPAPAPADAAPRLVVCQDESSMERAIERYLVDKHKMAVEEKFYKGDTSDLYLNLPCTGNPMPNYRINIDTHSDNRDDKTNQVIERAVQIDLFTAVKVTAPQRAAVMEVVNTWNKKKGFASVYVDDDGEVVCSWTLNVLPEGLHPEYVYDALARMQSNWKGLYPLVKAQMPD
jgi:thioredoxin-related protein